MLHSKIERSASILKCLDQKGRMTAKAIGQTTSMSVSYIEQLLSPLMRRGIVKGVKGPGGGYVIVESRRPVSLAEIALVYVSEKSMGEFSRSLLRLSRMVNVVKREETPRGQSAA